MAEPLVDVRNLHVVFHTPAGPRHVLNGVEFQLAAGSITGVVGETGSGKTVTAYTLLRLLRPPGEVTEGSVRFAGRELLSLPPEEMARLRGREMTMIFQQPRASLNPVFRVEDLLLDVLRTHRGIVGFEARLEAEAALREVGLPDPKRVLRSYPHELSGGMCQRVMIALALACRPKFLIADEPTTALDVTIQAQILALLQNLRDTFQLTILLITHDLGVVAEICDDVIVLYAGEVMEKAPVTDLFDLPLHPYTRGLMDSLPDPRSSRRLYTIPGGVPDLTKRFTGCQFHNRCPHARPVCADTRPALEEVGHGRFVRCHFWRELGGAGA
jgi:peptide/nickel transport system ATP-binding protein